MLTAEELFYERGETITAEMAAIEFAIAFAKLHVEAALQSAWESLDRLDDLDRNIIMESYPLTNIK